jgi:hypothetical protein
LTDLANGDAGRGIGRELEAEQIGIMNRKLLIWIMTIISILDREYAIYLILNQVEIDAADQIKEPNGKLNLIVFF